MLNATVIARRARADVRPSSSTNILVKAQADGSSVLLSDVARVELGSENYIHRQLSRTAIPASGIAGPARAGADALKTAKLVQVRRWTAGEGVLRRGYRYAYPNDSTAFIKVSVEEVVQTLLEAILLVVIVMLVFLQRWRATLIPAIAVPVVLLGTFGVLAVAGLQ